jgi:hypothetical protein
VDGQADLAGSRRRLTDRAARLLEAAGAAHLLTPAIDHVRRAMLEQAAASGTIVATPAPDAPYREHAAGDSRLDLAPACARGLLAGLREQVALGISRREQHAYPQMFTLQGWEPSVASGCSRPRLSSSKTPIQNPRTLLC